MATFLGLLHMLFSDTDEMFTSTTTSPSPSTDSSCSSSVSSPCLQADRSGRPGTYFGKQLFKDACTAEQPGIAVQPVYDPSVPFFHTQPSPFFVWPLDPWCSTEPIPFHSVGHATSLAPIPDTIDDASTHSSTSDCFSSCMAPVQGEMLYSYHYAPVPTTPPLMPATGNSSEALLATTMESSTSTEAGRRKLKSKSSFASSDPFEKPYACPHCHHRSRRRHNLREHMQTHNPHRRREFACQFCNRPFARKYDMKRHEKLHGHH